MTTSRRSGTLAAAVALACLGAVPAAAAPTAFAGWLESGARHTHRVVEGDTFRLVFRAPRDVRYRVCVVLLRGHFAACWSRTAAAGRPSRVDLTLPFIDFQGGWEAPFGDYVATWKVAGKAVAAWPFTWQSG